MPKIYQPIDARFIRTLDILSFLDLALSGVSTIQKPILDYANTIIIIIIIIMQYKARLS